LKFSLQCYLILYWSLIVILSIAVVIVKNAIESTSQSTTITRKYFHVLAIAVFLPGIIFDAHLMHLAASVALAAFLFLEVKSHGFQMWKPM